MWEFELAFDKSTRREQQILTSSSCSAFSRRISKHYHNIKQISINSDYLSELLLCKLTQKFWSAQLISSLSACALTNGVGENVSTWPRKHTWGEFFESIRQLRPDALADISDDAHTLYVWEEIKRRSPWAGVPHS